MTAAVGIFRILTIFLGKWISMGDPVVMDMTEDYVDRLRPVFDLCDTEKQGYISVQHFMSLAKEHFGAEQDGEEVC